MTVTIIQGNALHIPLPDNSVHCCVTSPPYYGLRDYGIDGQLGLEPSPDEYVANMVSVFREVGRVLRDDGTLWLNLGDSYNGSGNGGNAPRFRHAHSKNLATRLNDLKPKDLIGIPWRVAFALQADGWYLRSDIIWHKPNPMPESVRDRPTTAHEYMFLLSKAARYYYDYEAAREEVTLTTSQRNAYKRTRKQNGGGSAESMKGCDISALDFGDMQCGSFRNLRTVWTIATKPYPEAHFATFPPELVKKPIMAGCPKGGVVLDPFAGAGTTGLVAEGLRRDSVLIELSPAYCQMARKRLDFEPFSPIIDETEGFADLPLFETTER